MSSTTTLQSSTRLRARYDIYGPLDKDLRRTQSDLLDRLGGLDFYNSAAVITLIADLRKQIGTIRNDLSQLDDGSWLTELEALISALEAAAPVRRPALVRALYLAFSTFPLVMDYAAQPDLAAADFTDLFTELGFAA
jgi:hypothetical protein